MFTFLSHILAWEVNTAYIMKLVDEERYIVRSKGLIRVVDGSKLTDIANPIIAFEMVKVADDEYALKYCDNFHLSTKTTDPGIEASDYDSWVFMQHGDGFKLKQKNYGQCLTAVEHFDAANKGNYMNRRPCESTLPNVFQLLEIGDMDFQCLIDQPAICSELGLVK